MRTDEAAFSALPGRRGRVVLRRVALAAAAVLGLLALATVPLLLPSEPAAVGRTAEGDVRIRVALPEFHQRGADAQEVVAALREHGVEVDVAYGRDMAPWKMGAIIGVESAVSPAPGPFHRAAGGEVDITRIDTREYGIQYHDTGGFSIFPERFEGSVRIVIGVAPWQRMPEEPPSTTGES